MIEDLTNPLRPETSAEEYNRLYASASEGEASYDAYDKPYWKSHYYPLYKAVYDEVARLQARSVLEVGCGSGSFAHLLLSQSSIAYHGIDFSDVAIAKARARTGRPDCFSVANAQAVVDRVYDTVVCLEVLEHIENDRDVVAGWSKGTLCVCSVPNFDQPDHVRFFLDESQVMSRYGDLMDIKMTRRVPRALVRGRGWAEYLRHLRWSRNDPKKLLAMLGYRTFENLAGWIVFSGVRR